MKLFRNAIRFSKSDEGAITVDWVVLTAAIIGMALAFVVAISSGMTTLAGKVSTNLSEQDTGVE